MELTVDQALQQGVSAHKEGKLQDAERLYRAILQAQPNHPDANHNLGVLAVAVGKPLEAIPLFKLALEANPKIEQFWLSYIDVLITLEHFDEARRVLVEGEKSGVSSEKLDTFNQRLPRSEPNDINKTEKGQTLPGKRKKLAEKKKSKQRKVRDGPSSAAPSQNQVNHLKGHFQAGRFKEAEALARSLTQQFAKHPFGWKVLGAVFTQMGRLSESLAPKQRAAALSPQDAEAHSNLGNTLQELGRLDEAEASLRQAIALKPAFAKAHNNLGKTLKELGRLDEAEASYRQAIALKPDHAGAHNNLGNTLKELGKLAESEASLRRAIALRPNYAEVHYNLGNTLKKLKVLDEAEASYRQAIALRPDLAEAHCNLGVTLKELGRLDDSEASLRQAITLKSDFAKAHSNLGATLKRLGRLHEAAESYTQAAALEPENSSVKHLLAALRGNTTESAPLDYVERLFDNYATKFETALVDNLEYKTPKLIAEIILRDSNVDSLGSIIDLGCGTGLLGIEIRQFCEHLGGLDLSQNMLDEARKKSIYDELIRQDILGYLTSADLNFDYFIATDVFVYIGELSELFRLVKSRNKTRGKLVFSTEDYDGDGFFLEHSGRYSHSRMYIEGMCEKFGYTLRHFETQPLRKEENHYISGGLYILDF